jgi:hypothetical protein
VESGCMNGGKSREIPPSMPQIASAAISAGIRFIVCGCGRVAVAVRVSPDAGKTNNRAQRPKCREVFFIRRSRWFMGPGSPLVRLWPTFPDSGRL